MRLAGAGRPPAERALLLRHQRLALRNFLDNQTPGGLVPDRQGNRGPRRPHGLWSTAATGMGLIALALASAPLPAGDAAGRQPAHPRWVSSCNSAGRRKWLAG